MTGTIALYLRQSVARDDQADSLSLQSQEQRLRDYAERHGLDVAGVYRDLDVSGAAESRAGLDALFAHLRRGGVTHVGVYSLSRLARDSYLFLKLLKDLDKLRVQLVSASESTEDRTLVLVMSAFAERERIQISNHVAFAIRQSARQGKITQRLPYGYRRLPGNVVIVHEEEAAVVKRIFARFVAGETTGEIVAALIRDGIPSPGGGHWTHHNLRRLLRNRTYAGEIAISETRDPAGKIRPALVAQGNHPAIVDKSAYAAAQRLLDASGTGRRVAAFPAPWLSGFVWCGACGERAYVMNLPSNPVQPYWIVKCSTYQRSGNRMERSACPGQPIGALRAIEPIARRELAAAVAGLIDPAAAWEAERARIGERVTTRADELRRLIARREDALARAYAAYENGDVTMEHWQGRKRALSAEIEAHRAELATVPAVEPLGRYRADWEMAQGLDADIPLMSDAALRAILTATGARASVDIRAKTVDWRFAGRFGALTGRRLP